MILQPGQVVEKYTVLEELGRGGMAIVYKVSHNTLGSLHALKLLTITSAGIRERLVHEGQVQATLRHPNILAVTDVLEVDGAPGLIMEFVDGPTLEEWILSERPGPVEVEAVFRGIVRGVAEAHSAGLVHRDLKPANVLMATTLQGWVPKVADFGLVKALADGTESGGTKTGVPMGTPRFMAPEQILDAKGVDARADIWSLGAILYQMGTGRPPFPGDSVVEIFTNVQRGAVPDSGLPPHLEATLSGCLVRDVRARIQTCEALLAVMDARAPVRRTPPVADAPRRSSASARLPLIALGAGVGGLAAVAVVCLGVAVGLGGGAIAPSDPCDGPEGEVLGYAFGGKVFLLGTGASWTPRGGREVRVDYPNADNDYDGETEVLCDLPAGTRIQIEQRPIRVKGYGTWVPIVGGAVQRPATEEGE